MTIDKNKPVAIEGADWPVTIVDWDFDGNIAGIIETKSGKGFVVWKKDGTQVLGSGYNIINVPETVETFYNVYATRLNISSPKDSLSDANATYDKTGSSGKRVAILKLKWQGDKLVGHELIEVE